MENFTYHQRIQEMAIKMIKDIPIPVRLWIYDNEYIKEQLIEIVYPYAKIAVAQLAEAIRLGSVLHLSTVEEYLFENGYISELKAEVIEEEKLTYENCPCIGCQSYRLEQLKNKL